MGLLGGLCRECPARAAPPRPPSPLPRASALIPETPVHLGLGPGRRGGGRGVSGGASRVRDRGCVSSPYRPLRVAQAQVAEVAAVSAHFAAPAGLAATGATIAGVKYMFVRGEENEVIQCKKVSTIAHARFRRRPRPKPQSGPNSCPPPLRAPAAPPPRRPAAAARPPPVSRCPLDASRLRARRACTSTAATPASSSPTTTTRSSPATASPRWPSSATSSRSRASRRRRRSCVRQVEPVWMHALVAVNGVAGPRVPGPR